MRNNRLWASLGFIAPAEIPATFSLDKLSISHALSTRSLVFLQNMLTLLILTISIFSTIAVSARVPQASHVAPSLAAVPWRSPNLTLPLNTTASHNALSANKKLKIMCDSDRWGRNLKVKSCRDLFGYLAKDDNDQITFAQRDSGIQHEVPLPLRTLSSTFDHIQSVRERLHNLIDSW